MKRILISILFLALLLKGGAFAQTGDEPGLAEISADGPITLSVENTEITEVLKLFSMTRKINIIAGPEVQGNVSFDLYSVPFEEALESILGVAGFIHYQKGSIIYVTTEEAMEKLPLKSRNLQTRSFIIAHADGEAIAAVVAQFITPSGRSYLNKLENILVVHEIPENMPLIASLVAQQDVPAPQPIAPAEPHLVIQTFKIDHFDAEELVSTISKLFAESDTTIVTSVGDEEVATDGRLERKKSATEISYDEKTTFAQDSNLVEMVSGMNRVVLNKKQRIIAVQGTEQYVQAVADLIEQLDVPPPQVLISAQVLRISHNDDMNTGVELRRSWWDSDAMNPSKVGAMNGAVSDNGIFTLDTINDAGKSLLYGQLESGAAGFTWGGIWKNREILLSALSTQSNVETLAAPELLVIDGEQASIKIGERLGYKAIAITTNAGNDREDVDFLEVGTDLRVTPFIAKDGLVRLVIYPEVSSGDINAVTGLPNESTTEVNTTMLVQDQDTLVIGGLMDRKRERIRSQVPFLGDLPYIGFLFGHNTWTERNVEIVVLITPRIVGPTQTPFIEDKIDDYTAPATVYPLAPTQPEDDGPNAPWRFFK